MMNEWMRRKKSHRNHSQKVAREARMRRKKIKLKSFATWHFTDNFSASFTSSSSWCALIHSDVKQELCHFVYAHFANLRFKHVLQMSQHTLRELWWIPFNGYANTTICSFFMDATRLKFLHYFCKELQWHLAFFSSCKLTINIIINIKMHETFEWWCTFYSTILIPFVVIQKNPKRSFCYITLCCLMHHDMHLTLIILVGINAVCEDEI